MRVVVPAGLWFAVLLPVSCAQVIAGMKPPCRAMHCASFQVSSGGATAKEHDMPLGFSRLIATLLLAVLPIAPALAGPPTGAAALSVDGLSIILAAGASQCDDRCMNGYDQCVANGLAAQSVADDEVVYEECSLTLSQCRDVCVSQGACIMSDSGFVLCP